MKNRRQIQQQQRVFQSQENKTTKTESPVHVLDTQVNQVSQQRNLKTLARIRTIGAVNSGLLAGIFGMQGLWGILFYVGMFLVVSGVLLVRTGGKPGGFFVSGSEMVVGGMGADVLLYLMMWVIFHNLVNVL